MVFETIPKSSRCSSWSCIRAIRGDRTRDTPWATTAGNWKHRDFPAPVGMETKTSSWPENEHKKCSTKLWHKFVVISDFNIEKRRYKYWTDVLLVLVFLVFICVHVKFLSSWEGFCFVKTHSAGLEINFLEHWPSGPPAPKIWWSSSISGGPVKFFKIVSKYTTLLHNFWLGNFSGLSTTATHYSEQRN